MEITVNRKEVLVRSSLNLEEYLKASNLSDVRGIAVAVNERVIAKKLWQSLVLQENDKILIIRATQGG